MYANDNRAPLCSQPDLHAQRKLLVNLIASEFLEFFQSKGYLVGEPSYADNPRKGKYMACVCVHDPQNISTFTAIFMGDKRGH